MPTALIYAIHRTHPWWRHVGDHLGFERVTVLTDRRGEGDRSVTDDFYCAYKEHRAKGLRSSPLLTECEVDDAIARCRVLRGKKLEQATAMVLAMADAMDDALAAEEPDYVLSFPIDNYVQDVLARRARARGVPYFELALSALPGMCMLLHRGRLINSMSPPDSEALRLKVKEVSEPLNPLFRPAYVQTRKRPTTFRFLRTFAYFRVRGLFFALYAALKRDPLNFHYLEAQPDLGYKPELRDRKIFDLIDYDWESRLAAFPSSRRVLFGLQVSPEASLDYWIDDLKMAQHEDMLLELAQVFSDAGFQVVVKDHPLQFGHRQVAFVRALKQIENVVVCPHEVAGDTVLDRVGINATATGTLGLQAALMGKISIVGDAYYANPTDFINVRQWSDLATLPDAVDQAEAPDLDARRTRIVSHLMSGSFEADIFSSWNFDPAKPAPAAAALARNVGMRLRQLGPQGEAWHARNLLPGSGSHQGSPLN